jgi:hypothetical protein
MRRGCGGRVTNEKLGRVGRAAALLWGAAALGPGPALAQDTANERIAAETLFREALQLMGDGNYSEACPKLAESQRLDPGLGTLINLALCHEAEGKTASAWLEFSEAASLARQNKRPDRERVARQHIKALEPKLSKLAVRVSAEARAVPGLEVQRDGIAIKEGVWGSAIPVDPGRHEVTATAAGYEPWSTALEVSLEPKQHEVNVPGLTKKKEEPPPPAPAPAPSPPPSAQASVSSQSFSLSQRTVGFAVGGVGLASMLVGGYFGYQAISKSTKADNRCPDEACSNQEGVDLSKEADTSAVVADVAMGVGLVGLGVGAYLVLTAPPPASKPAASARRATLPERWLVPQVGRDHVALQFGGVW